MSPTKKLVASNYKGRLLSITGAPVGGVVQTLRDWNTHQPAYLGMQILSVGGVPQHLVAFVPEMSWKEVVALCRKHGVDPE